MDADRLEVFEISSPSESPRPGGFLIDGLDDEPLVEGLADNDRIKVNHFPYLVIRVISLSSPLVKCSDAGTGGFVREYDFEACQDSY
jgi:hypothetical protein